MQLRKYLEQRNKHLTDLHKKVSKEIESLLDYRISISGAIKELSYIQNIAKKEKKDDTI